MKSYKKPYRNHTVLSLFGLAVSLVAIVAGLSLHSFPYTIAFIVAAAFFIAFSISSFLWWDRPQ